MSRRRSSLRVFRYSPLNFPGYYLVPLCAVLLVHLLVDDPPTWAVALVAAFSLLPHWRAFVFVGQIGAIVSSRRVYIRGVTPRYGILKRNLITRDIVYPVNNAFYRLTKAIEIPDDPRRRSRTLGYFSSDSFSFLSMRWSAVFLTQH